MEQKGLENRKLGRLRTKMDVIINCSIKANALDISEGGMFIHTPIPFPKDSFIELKFALSPGTPPINVKARVQYVHSGLAIGVAFHNLLVTDRVRIKKFVDDNIGEDKGFGDGFAVDTRKKILIVDDSPTTKTMVKNKLIQTGLAVRDAENGIEALKAIEKEVPDIIIMDLLMKGIDGEKFLHILRTMEEWRDVKIVILSGNISTETLEKVAPFGVAAMLPKRTTTPKKLTEKIREILGEK